MPGFEEDRDYFNGGGTKAKKLKPVTATNDGTLVNFAKVFLYMFIYLAITGAVAFGLGYWIWSSYVNSGYTDEIPTLYLGLIIGSAVAMVILMLVINFIVIRGKHSVLVPSILYSIFVGVLLSTFTIFMDWKVIGIAFGITAGVFALMSLIAFLTKGNMWPLAILGIGLIFGGGLLALINVLMGSTVIMWAVTFIIFAAIMFIAMFDVWNVKKICEQGSMSKNLSYYCAFIMYVDFINIFIRVLYFVALIMGKSKS